MSNFRFYICGRDLINLAKGNMYDIRWYPKRMKQCADAFCDQEIVEIILTVNHAKKNDTKPAVDKKRPIRNRLPKANRPGK